MLKRLLRNTLHILTRPLHYMRMRVASGRLQKQNLSAEKPLRNLYTHCFQVSLETFIRCLIHKDFSGLIIRGKPPERDIITAWDYLYMEYCDLSGSVSEKRIMSLGREIGSMEAKLMLIRTCVLILSMRYSQKAVDLLAKNGYKYPLDYNNPEEYMATLAKIITKSKAIEISIEQKVFEHAQLKKKYEGQPVTEEYFDELLVELSRFMGDMLHKDQITVTEFIAIRNRFEKECRAMERQQEKLKQGSNKYKR